MLALFAEYASGNQQVIPHWFSVLEMRAAMAAEVVRLCALRASPALRQEIAAISQAMVVSTTAQEVYTLELRFWDRVLEGADNLAYRLAFNSLVKSAFRMGSAAADLSVQEVRNSGYRVSLAEAIVAGDAERAETETRVRMRIELETLTKLFGHARPSLAAVPSDADAVPQLESAPAGALKAVSKPSVTSQPAAKARGEHQP